MNAKLFILQITKPGCEETPNYVRNRCEVLANLVSVSAQIDQDGATAKALVSAITAPAWTDKDQQDWVWRITEVERLMAVISSQQAEIVQLKRQLAASVDESATLHADLLKNTPPGSGWRPG